MNTSYIVRLFLIVGAILFSCAEFSAQELKAVSFRLLPDDNTAMEKPCLDVRKDPCALIKIKADGLKGFLFPRNDHIKDYYDEQEKVYGIYLPANEARAHFHYDHSEFLSGDIKLRDIKGYTPLEPGKTYLLEMEAPASATNTIVVLKVSYPTDAVVTFNGNTLPVSPKGIYEIPVQPNTYSYTIQSDNFVPTRGTVSVEKGETKTITKRLQPITHLVNVECNIKGARVYVDDTDYGVVGKLRLPQGKHTIRVQMTGYIDDGGDVNISAETTTLSYKLKKNRNLKEKYPTDVTIYSTHNSKSMYMNEAKIKGWTNGAVVKMWPGKYLISDDERNEIEIVVKENKPMTIRL